MRFLLILLLITTVNTGTYAQAFLKTEYIGSSSYEDIDNNKTGGKGDAKVISGGVQIPFCEDERKQPPHDMGYGYRRFIYFVQQ